MGVLGAQPVTRHEARTPEGIAMLEKYAKAVSVMKNTKLTPPGSPLSWQFQWFMHWTPKDKDELIRETYPKGEPAAFRDLAVKTWATCQAHFAPQSREPFFLPWHRWYLAFFEAILRATLKDDAFALPYWDYLKDPTLPPQFLMPGDATFDPLFHENRGDGIGNKPVNKGDAIMTTTAIQRMMHDALCQPGYPIRSRAEPGFCAHIDFNLHGGVHGAIGGDMGSVPTAAQDPIFWLHHCNIDRLWASWTANGGRNPTDDGFKKEPLTFADANGKLITRAAGGAVDTGPLGYRFDRLEPRSGDCPIATRETAPVATHRAKSPGSLEAGGTRVALAAFGGAARETAADRIELVIGDVATSAAPGTVYNVYVNLSENANEQERQARLAGLINFFDLAPHLNHRARNDKFFTFDITNILRETGGEGVTVTIIPRGRVVGNARPTAGDVQVFRR
jgi:tyrosinase